MNVYWFGSIKYIFILLFFEVTYVSIHTLLPYILICVEIKCPATVKGILLLKYFFFFFYLQLLHRMTKSKAEIQKVYRERKKAARRKKKERVRVHKYYVPAASLLASKLKTRNLNNKFRYRLSRLRKSQLAYTEGSSGYVSSTGEETPGPSTRQTTPLVVKMPGIQSQLSSGRSAGPKKARSRALARAHKSL